MKRWMFLLWLLLILPGCSAEQRSLEFSFCSGAGAWNTYLVLQEDGTFHGAFHDTDMGDTGTDYPNGTEYICNFSGRFEKFEQIEDTMWTMQLAELVTDQKAGVVWIEDETRYIAATAYGLDEGAEFIVYGPETPVEGLSEDFMSWWPMQWEPEEARPETLSCYGIYNVEMGYGFFS